MENGRQEEREEGGWREVPALLKAETVQAAVRNHLESKGLGARQLEPKQRLRRPRMAGKKPPLPPQVWVSDERVCFGVALEAPQPKQLLEPLDGRGIGVWLPRVFAECVRVLRENVGVAGIFRKSGSLTRQRVLRSTLECGEELSSPNVHDVASVLKQYLREIPTPLLPPSIGPALEWAWSCEKGERVDIVMCALLQLPHPHLQMARELCNLMSLVASHQSQSLMDSHSLAVVMTPNIMPTQHSNPANLETHLTTSTGIVELMIDHAHLIGLVPAHVINHAHQLAKINESATSSNESLETGDAKKDKQKRISVTDKVLGWGTKLMSTLGGGSRDVVDYTHSPFGSNEDGGGLQMGKSQLFDPSLPLHSRATPKTPRSGHKRRRSFLSARRHTDGRHGHRSLFTNPFRGPTLKGGEFSRLGSAR
ncbi:Rho GTPase-activating protein 11A [Geodia barretti]|uniref:Rho GTPase-activating protein 11A n=2 Tax=Geodia barretti TaxID=519541 RepID=A0AA35TIX2_GEOBA|nr:Rho GTPase-activating protein 11A [Geodia barretti]